MKITRNVNLLLPVLLTYVSVSYTHLDVYKRQLEGYTKLFENMLNHENIEIELNKDAKEDLSFDMQTHQVYYQGQLWQGKIIFTGAIDDFFDHCLGRLPYRSLRFEYEHYPEDHYQSCLLYTSRISIKIIYQICFDFMIFYEKKTVWEYIFHEGYPDDIVVPIFCLLYTSRCV